MRIVQYIAISLVSFLLVSIPDKSSAQFGLEMGTQNAANLERSAEELQESLIWVNYYNGMVDGKLGRRAIAAVRKFQASHGYKESGKLTDGQYAELVEEASQVQSQFGWTIFEHPSLGYRIGYPARELQDAESLTNGGRRFFTKNGKLELKVEIAATDLRSLKQLYEMLSRATNERSIRYHRHKNNWFVVLGNYEGNEFYTRVEEHNGLLVGYTFRWPYVRNSELERVSLAMVSSFYVPRSIDLPLNFKPSVPTDTEPEIAPQSESPLLDTKDVVISEEKGKELPKINRLSYNTGNLKNQSNKIPIEKLATEIISNQDFQKTLIIIVVITFVLLLFFGATNKIVVYYSAKDLIVSFMPWGSMIATLILIDVYQDTGDVDYDNLSDIQTIVWYGGIICSIGFCFRSFQLSIKYNKSLIVGVLVGIFKITASLIGVLAIAGQLGTIFDKKSTRQEAFVAILVFGIFIWIGDRLINGERVYLEKGWELPS